MKLRQPIAVLGVTALAAGGLAVGASAATAAPEPVYLPASSIVFDADESNVYNQWHLAPNPSTPRVEQVEQAENGFIVEAGTNAELLKGNGNDQYGLDGEVIPNATGAPLPDATTISALAESLEIEASDVADITFQIPVRVDTDGNGVWESEGWTTLRSAAGVENADWTTSKSIPGSSFGANAVAPLEDLVEALGTNAYPIGAGFLVYSPASDVIVSSFTANGEQTVFTEAPDDGDNGGGDNGGGDGDNGGEPTKPTVKFTDVTKDAKFSKEITWMAERGLSTGIKKTDANGEVYYDYEPKTAVTREAMAAFLYRLADPKGYTAPEVSPFADVKPGDKFYKQIAWMHEKKLSTGIKQASGLPHFAPKTKVTREAMAAFINRAKADKSYTVPKRSPFADVRPADKFYAQIAWMFDAGVSTGIKQASGQPTYAPKSSVTREAMAAFLYRADKL